VYMVVSLMMVMVVMLVSMLKMIVTVGSPTNVIFFTVVSTAIGITTVLFMMVSVVRA
jgi:hypothetical protein